MVAQERCSGGVNLEPLPSIPVATPKFLIFESSMPHIVYDIPLRADQFVKGMGAIMRGYRGLNVKVNKECFRTPLDAGVPQQCSEKRSLVDGIELAMKATGITRGQLWVETEVSEFFYPVTATPELDDLDILQKEVESAIEKTLSFLHLNQLAGVNQLEGTDIKRHEYIDCVFINLATIKDDIRLANIYRAFSAIIATSGRVRHLGVMHASLKQLKIIWELSAGPLRIDRLVVKPSVVRFNLSALSTRDKDQPLIFCQELGIPFQVVPVKPLELRQYWGYSTIDLHNDFRKCARKLEVHGFTLVYALILWFGPATTVVHKDNEHHYDDTVLEDVARIRNPKTMLKNPEYESLATRLVERLQQPPFEKPGEVKLNPQQCDFPDDDHASIENASGGQKTESYVKGARRGGRHHRYSQGRGRYVGRALRGGRWDNVPSPGRKSLTPALESPGAGPSQQEQDNNKTFPTKVDIEGQAEEPQGSLPPQALSALPNPPEKPQKSQKNSENIDGGDDISQLGPETFSMVTGELKDANEDRKDPRHAKGGNDAPEILQNPLGSKPSGVTSAQYWSALAHKVRIAIKQEDKIPPKPPSPTPPPPPPQKEHNDGEQKVSKSPWRKGKEPPRVKRRGPLDVFGATPSGSLGTKQLGDRQEDNTKKDNTKKDNTKKDNTKKGSTKMDNTRKDNTKKDNTKKDNTKKNDTPFQKPSSSRLVFKKMTRGKASPTREGSAPSEQSDPAWAKLETHTGYTSLGEGWVQDVGVSLASRAAPEPPILGPTGGETVGTKDQNASSLAPKSLVLPDWKDTAEMQMKNASEARSLQGHFTSLPPGQYQSHRSGESTSIGTQIHETPSVNERGVVLTQDSSKKEATAPQDQKTIAKTQIEEHAARKLCQHRSPLNEKEVGTLEDSTTSLLPQQSQPLPGKEAIEVQNRYRPRQRSRSLNLRTPPTGEQDPTTLPIPEAIASSTQNEHVVDYIEGIEDICIEDNEGGENESVDNGSEYSTNSEGIRDRDDERRHHLERDYSQGVWPRFYPGSRRHSSAPASRRSKANFGRDCTV
ncbi:hypothetical protein TWF718_000239 [Orbilia javanica]|uniref:Uncharacterized protein n=1 Tax=Orbilia javanica TaxID=47235 RepID=A0AAN8RFQ5_9PEZI